MNVEITPRAAQILADILANSSGEWPWLIHPNTEQMTEADAAELRALIKKLEGA